MSATVAPKEEDIITDKELINGLFLDFFLFNLSLALLDDNAAIANNGLPHTHASAINVLGRKSLPKTMEKDDYLSSLTYDFAARAHMSDARLPLPASMKGEYALAPLNLDISFTPASYYITKSDDAGLVKIAQSLPAGSISTKLTSSDLDELCKSNPLFLSAFCPVLRCVYGRAHAHNSKLSFDTKELHGAELSAHIRVTLSKRLSTPWEIFRLVPKDKNKEDLDALAPRAVVHFIENDKWMFMDWSEVTNSTDFITVLSENIVVCADTNSANSDASALLLKGEVFDAAFDNEVTTQETVALVHEEKISFKNILVDNKGADARAAIDDARERLEQEQEDPFISEDELAGAELEFLCGSEEQLETDLRTLFYAAIPCDAWQRNNISSLSIIVRASDDESAENAHVDFDDMLYSYDGASFKELHEYLANKDSGQAFNALEKACATVVSENEPTGFTWEYNDGSYDRRSGYSKTASVLTFVISAPSAHEHIGAKIEIKTWARRLGKKTVEQLLKAGTVESNTSTI